MKEQCPAIIPNIGFNSIRFGMSEDDVNRRLGAPEEMENPTEEGNIIYGYESKGINILAFEKEENFRLVHIELNSKSNAILWDTRIFDKSLAEIMKISSALGYSLKLVDILEDNDLNIYQELYSIESLNLDLYFDRSKSLNEIGLGVLTNKDDETEWPE